MVLKPEADLPRYKYHLDLVQTIVRQAQQKGIPDTSPIFESTILVFGRITEEYRNLFEPLTIEKCPCNGTSFDTLMFSLELYT